VKITLSLSALFVAGLLALPARSADKDTDKPKDKDDEGFVSLFDGKTLKGWKSHPDNPGEWKVEDGAIIGSGKMSHLFSERDDYTDFVFRAEIMINDKGNSGQYFRTKFAKGFPPGYEAQVNSTHGDPIRTGSLYGFPKFADKTVVKEMLVKPDTWFTQEVTAEGNHIIIKVNGKTTVDFVDEENRFTKGHFAFQQHDPGTVVKIRKVEVKELKK